MTECPPPANLKRLFLGGLPPPDAEAIEQHVQTCQRCGKQLGELLAAKDPLADLLQRAPDSEALSQNPVVIGLVQKIKRLRPVSPSLDSQGTPMLTIACSACQKKLAIKEEHAGKKVKCPACGQLMVVPDKIAVAVGAEEQRALPPASEADASNTPSSSQATSDLRPTNPSLSKPDPTHDIEIHEADHGDSLTDFLAPPQAEDELGRLGDFRILKVLGHGGMGVVFLGEDTTLSRKVAIKAMLPHLAQSKSSQQRFLREARSAAALEHDHIVAIHHVGVDRGAPYIVMPFLKGQPLDERLKGAGPLPLAEVLRIGREVARALDAAHQQGLIHRDIKPANIWLEAPEDRVKILDFGLARLAAQESGLTQQGAIIGTPAYMAPEQGRGDTLDARCDLFSLGVVLYRLCTGQQPFHGNDTVSTLMSVAMHEPPPPLQMNAELPAELSALVMKLLEKDAAKRIGSAHEVVQALQRIEKELARKKAATEDTIGESYRPTKELAAAQPSACNTQPIKAVMPRRRSRRPVVAMALLLLALLGGGLLTVLVWYWQTPNGVIRIEINDPDIQVALDKEGPIFKGADKQEIKVKAGEHGLHIERGDLKFDTDKFILKKGETVTLKVEWYKDGKLQVVQDGRVIGAQAQPKIDVAVVSPISKRFALRFDGKNNSIAVPAPLELSQPFTVEGYFTMEGKNSGAWLFHSEAQVNLQPGWNFHLRGQKKNSWMSNSVSFPMASDRKTHVAGVYTGKEILLFLDGKLVGSKNTEKDQPHPGRVALKLVNGFRGTIEEARISQVARYEKDFTPAKRFETNKDTLALYHFDEGQGDLLKDSSGNGYDGKIIGGTWVNADGTAIPRSSDQSGSVLAFDGAGAVQIPPAMKVPVGDFTLEAYASVSGPSAFSDTTLVGGPRSQTNRIALIAIRDERWGFRVQPGNTMNVVSVPVVSNSFSHLAGVRSGDDLLLFVDGKRVGTKKLTGPLQIQTDAFQIGNSFVGKIGKVRVSKVARYDKDFTPQKRFEPDADTLALYYFDEGQGDVLKDSSGNGHHGKIIGAKWVKADGSSISSAPLLDDAWFKQVAALPAKEQVQAVADKLKERNPGFDGEITSKIEKGVVTQVRFLTEQVTDLSPVRALKGLSALYCTGTYARPGKLADLSPLKGMPLTYLACSLTQVSDLTPLKSMARLTDLVCSDTLVSDLSSLKDMKLKYLVCGNTKVVDLTPLRGLPLVVLHCEQTNISNLSPLQGMKLTKVVINNTLVSDLSPLKDAKLMDLRCDTTKVSDLSPLKGMKLTTLGCKFTQVTDLSPLRGMPLQSLSCDFKAERDAEVLRSLKTLKTINGKPAELFWKEVAAQPAFDAWLKKASAMPVEEQVQAVADKLKERNPGFDGKLASHQIKKGVVTGLAVVTDKVTDISPVRALPGLTNLDLIPSSPSGKFSDLSPLKDMRLKVLNCGYTSVSDLSPLKDMRLTVLYCGFTSVTDLSPLKDMKLTTLNCGHTPVVDLSPLQDMPLTDLHCQDTKVNDLTPLRRMKLTTLNCNTTAVSDLSPLKGMKLTVLDCLQTRVTDLSPLQGMPLKEIKCDFKAERDADVLRSLKTLETINGTPAAAFWKKVDQQKLEKAP